MASFLSLRTVSRLVGQYRWVCYPRTSSPGGQLAHCLRTAPSYASSVRSFHKSCAVASDPPASSPQNPNQTPSQEDKTQQDILAGFGGKTSTVPSTPPDSSADTELPTPPDDDGSVDPAYLLNPYRTADGKLNMWSVPLPVLGEYERRLAIYRARQAQPHFVTAGAPDHVLALKDAMERDVARRAEERLLLAIDQLLTEYPAVTEETFETEMEKVRAEVTQMQNEANQENVQRLEELRSKPRSEVEAALQEVVDRSRVHQKRASLSAADDPKIYTERNELPLTDRFYTNAVWVLPKGDVPTILPEGLSGGYRKDFEKHKFVKQYPFLVRASAVRLANTVQRAAEAGFIGHRPYITLTGPRGSGKSTALTQLVIWARQNGWIVAFVPDAKHWVRGIRIEESQIEPGMWDQNEIAIEFAKSMLAVHAEQLRTLPVRLPLPLTLHNFPKGQSTLADLLEYAVKDTEGSNTDAVIHFRKELNLVTEFPVLIAVDGINLLFNNSPYGDPMTKEKNIVPPLPAQRLILTRYFSDFSTHGLANGMYVTALCREAPVENFVRQFGGVDYGRYTTPKTRATRSCYQIEPYTHFEYDMWVHFNRVHKLYPMEEQLTNPTKEFIYFICQGNPAEISKYEKVL